jgi:16S rRNA C967 or C1407 C5-methylase (RsmB/RsmF family)
MTKKIRTLDTPVTEESSNSAAIDTELIEHNEAKMQPLTDRMKGWKERVSENADWDKYYSVQNICENAEELETMKKTFQSPLPVAIRLNSSAPAYADVGDKLKSLSKLDEARPNKCSNLTWAVDGNSWQWGDISRVHVRKDPSLVQLKKWLVDHESIGTLTRQEAVSMIPPLVLDPKPRDIVLDMCAAPGSKTCQMIEMVSESGVVIANDVEWKRANMLSHQVQRLCSPANIVCNVDACMFPSVPGGFDKILCDVPCTGDGTIRKASDIWRRWCITDGHNIHARQYQILCRGLQMLKPGGTLVYSTCSLNPIENEAVITAALEKFSKSNVSIVPLDPLPGLKYRAGLGTWSVIDDKTNEIVSRETYSQLEKENKQGRLRATMYPSLNESIVSQVKHSARFLPHLMNTGGFFVAKFVKAFTDEVPTNVAEINKDYHLVSEDLYENLVSFYGLSRDIVDRSHDRHIYYVSREAGKLLNSSISTALKLVSIGVRVFAEIGKWESPCQYRMTQEGVHAFRDAMTNSTRITLIDMDLMKELVETREVKTERIAGFATAGFPKGGAVVIAKDAFGGICRMAVMVSPVVTQAYAEKLYCGWLLNILKNENDPTRDM